MQHCWAAVVALIAVALAVVVVVEVDVEVEVAIGTEAVVLEATIMFYSFD